MTRVNGAAWKLHSQRATEQLTFLLSLSHVEKPLVSWYWSPKYQTSRSPMVLTTFKNTSKGTLMVTFHHLMIH